MANTTVIRPAGKTVALSVTNTVHASTLVANSINDQVNFAAFQNTGASPVAIAFSATSPAPNATFPVDGTVGDYVLPANMSYPVTLAVPVGNYPATGFYMTAISNSATASIVYVTPVADQS